MELPRLRIGKVGPLTVYIKDRHIHTLNLGSTGTGKTVLMIRMWIQDNYFPVAKVLIEPTGFLARKAYSVCKKARYIGMGFKISLNPMLLPYDPNAIVDIIVECVNQVIKLATQEAVKFLTPKMVAILGPAIKHCLSTNRRSLINVRDYLMNVKGDIQTRDGIIQRLNFLLNDERFNDIICGQDSVDFGQLIENAETLIVDCSQMSKDKMIFLGNIVIQGIKNYFRYSRPEIYKPLALYVDECHNFVNPNFYDILKEGRQYKISACLATQDLATVDETTRRLMLNIHNIVAFRLGNREASYIAKEMNVTAQEIQFVEKYHFHYKTPEGRGMAKADYPPYITPKEITPMTKPATETITWFPLHPYHPDETLTSPAVPVEALKKRAETPLSETTDG